MNNPIQAQLKYVWLLEQPGYELTWRPKWFVETLESIFNQTVALWQLTIVVPPQYVPVVRQALTDYWPIHHKPRRQISVVNSKDAHPERILRAVIRKSKLDWAAVVMGYDTLALDATYTLLKAALQEPRPNVIYGDHDYLSSRRQTNLVCTKQSFCEDLLCSQNYIGTFFAINRTALFGHGSPTDGLELGWAHDVLLRVSASTHNCVIPIVHVAGVVYHYRRKHSNSTIRQQTVNQSLQAVRKHFLRKGIAVKTKRHRQFVLRNEWPIPEAEPKVSLIIPTRDGYRILKACIDSILKRTQYKNFEILIIDNQSSDPKTLQYLKGLTKSDPRIRILSYNKPFNYSAINNFAVKHCTGQIIGFINNDVEVLNADWLTEMVSHALRQNVGAVGALLFYPDMTVQHGGVIVGMRGVADHAFKGADPKSVHDDPFGMLQSVRSADAVTAAVMLVRKENFNAVGCFDQRYLKVAFNDVDLCLKLQQKNLQIIYTPHAQLIHHESKSRRLDVSVKAQQTERYEHTIMKSRWGTDRLHSTL